MDLFKRLCLVIASTTLTVCGALLLVSVLGETAAAFPGVPTSAPEIDPGAISGAMGLLMGSILVLTGKCVRK